MRKLVTIVFLTLCLLPVTRAQTPAQTPAPTASHPKDYTAHVVGYAHMDMAWLWRWEESIHDIMYNTFTNQIRLMDVRTGAGGDDVPHARGSGGIGEQYGIRFGSLCLE